MSSELPPPAADARPEGALSGWLDDYAADVTTGDLFLGAGDADAGRWIAMAQGLSSISEGDPVALQDMVGRHIVDLGLTFREAGDAEERSWPLTPMPLIVGAQEWEQVERGLIQRATLLDKLAADIYGPQNLVAQGHLPAAVIAGSPYFARRMVGRGTQSGHFIHLYAADLVRGPRGQWRVLQDRVRLATGIGYALENRLAMSRATDSLLADSNVRRVAQFFASMRQGLAADCRRENPRIALLTPGRYNQTYAEQAHLARYLGLPLVEGRDLNVTDDRLFVGTIAGPKRVDAVWRWVNTNSLDPLAFDAKSEIGVPNLFDAWASGGVEVANRPGVEVLESPAFCAFLPRLFWELLGEEAILPTAATWWCGQSAEAQIVRDRIDELALISAFGEPVDGLPGLGLVAGADLDPAERTALFEAMRRRPMDYCGQEIVHLSTTPAIIDGQIVPRPFTIRAFVARTADGGWTVMPGGFARLSSTDALPTTLIGAGDLSADVWVVDGVAEQQPISLISDEPHISRGGGILASQAADNLFWFGRYNERAELTVRIIRSILGNSIEVDGGRAGDGEVRRGLIQLLALWGAIDPAHSTEHIPEVCGRAMSDVAMQGSVAALIRTRHDVGMALRERFSREYWRLISRPMPHVDEHRPQQVLTVAKGLTEHFSAAAGLASENMIRGPAWRFLEIGKRIERAIATCRVASQLSQMVDTREALNVLLDLCDSQIVYRTRYLTGPMANPVRDLVLLDPGNPRALAFQVAEIAGHLAALPGSRDDNMPEDALRLARALDGSLQSAVAPDMTVARLAEVEGQLLQISDAISSRYFLQLGDAESATRRSILA